MKKILFLLLASFLVLAACGTASKPEVEKYTYNPEGSEKKIKEEAKKISDKKRNRDFNSDKYYADHEYEEELSNEIKPFTDDDSKLNKYYENINDAEDIADFKKSDLDEIKGIIKEIKKIKNDKDNRDKKLPKHLKMVDDNYYKGIDIMYSSFKDLSNILENKDELDKKELEKANDNFTNNMDVATKYFNFSEKLMDAIGESYEENGIALDFSEITENDNSPTDEDENGDVDLDEDENEETVSKEEYNEMVDEYNTMENKPSKKQHVNSDVSQDEYNALVDEYNDLVDEEYDENSDEDKDSEETDE